MKINPMFLERRKAILDRLRTHDPEAVRDLEDIDRGISGQETTFILTNEYARMGFMDATCKYLNKVGEASIDEIVRALQAGGCDPPLDRGKPKEPRTFKWRLTSSLMTYIGKAKKRGKESAIVRTGDHLSLKVERSAPE